MDYQNSDTKGLNILYELQENLCVKLSQDLKEMKDKESDNYKNKIQYLEYSLHELDLISKEINNRKSKELIYSIEDIYKFAGQFDKYLIFRFYPTTEAYKKYGKEVNGYIKYTKKEREKLEKVITEEKYTRNDGIVLLNGAGQNEEINKILESEGFYASEVFELLTMETGEVTKKYKKEGQKEIPNTTVIPFDTSDFDLERLQVYLVAKKIESGYTLLWHELLDYYCNLYILSPDSLTQEIKEKYLLEEDKENFTHEAELQINLKKYRRGLLNNDEKTHLNELLKKRRKERFKIIKSELGISNNQLEKFRNEYPDKYRELYGVTLTFETETLSEYKTENPIYWDFERFIHIYLRHYKNFFIESSTYRGTHFQYSYHDIRRLVRLIIESLKEDIEFALNHGNPYAKYGDQGYYFNGNFFNLRIDKDGRIMQFHPLEDK